MTNLAFEIIPIEENKDPMVNLKHYPFVLAPMYYEWDLSDSPDLWVRKTIADKLVQIQKDHLESLDRKFKIWDPWRSRIVQNNIYQKFWDELSEEHPEWDEERLIHEVGIFVTKADNPKRIPPHATGGSIDLTVVEADGSEMDFGTVFDHFGPEAAIGYFEDNNENNTARDNQRWLHEIMTENGFGVYEDEWWHFDFGNQLWALTTGKDKALFGEVVDPIQFNNSHDLDRGIKHAL